MLAVLAGWPAARCARSRAGPGADPARARRRRSCSASALVTKDMTAVVHRRAAGARRAVAAHRCRWATVRRTLAVVPVPYVIYLAVSRSPAAAATGSTAKVGGVLRMLGVDQETGFNAAPGANLIGPADRAAHPLRHELRAAGLGLFAGSPPRSQPSPPAGWSGWSRPTTGLARRLLASSAAPRRSSSATTSWSPGSSPPARGGAGPRGSPPARRRRSRRSARLRRHGGGAGHPAPGRPPTTASCRRAPTLDDPARRQPGGGHRRHRGVRVLPHDRLGRMGVAARRWQTTARSTCSPGAAGSASGTATPRPSCCTGSRRTPRRCSRSTGPTNGTPSLAARPGGALDAAVAAGVTLPAGAGGMPVTCAGLGGAWPRRRRCSLPHAACARPAEPASAQPGSPSVSWARSCAADRVGGSSRPGCGRRAGVAWSRFEPAPEQFDHGLHRRGARPASPGAGRGPRRRAHPGFQYPPAWVRDLPDAGTAPERRGDPRRRCRNSSSAPTVRGAASAYLGPVRRRVSDRLDGVASRRCGSGRARRASSAIPGDRSSARRATASGRSTTPRSDRRRAGRRDAAVTRCRAGCPASATGGAPVTPEQAVAWFGWYADSPVDTVVWQIGAAARAGLPRRRARAASPGGGPARRPAAAVDGAARRPRRP